MSQSRVRIEEFNKIIIVFNRNSGKQIFTSVLARVNEIYKHLKDLVGSKRIEICNIERFCQVDGIVDKIVAERAAWVIIAGGDGTIRSVIEKLDNRDYRPYISVFPAGTVNLIAKELLVSNEPIKWMKRMIKGIEVPVYLGRANGNLFLTVAGIGFDSLVVDNVTELDKKLFNKMAYVMQGTDTIRQEMIFKNWQYRFQVRFDDETVWHDASSVIVGKSRYYAGRYTLFNRASLSEPILHAALFTGSSRADFLRYAACIAMEDLQSDDTISLHRAKKIEIKCNVDNFAVELDGDAITTAPLLLELEEKPIKFLA